MAGPGRFDNGPALEVRLTSGALESVTQAGLLAGGNLAAIGDGTAGGWELFQFAEALLVGPNTYHLSLRLRGQLGSDALMPPVWPAGSTFVLMNGVPSQINLPRSLRRVAQHYRVGPPCAFAGGGQQWRGSGHALDPADAQRRGSVGSG